MKIFYQRITGYITEAQIQSIIGQTSGNPKSLQDLRPCGTDVSFADWTDIFCRIINTTEINQILDEWSLSEEDRRIASDLLQRAREYFGRNGKIIRTKDIDFQNNFNRLLELCPHHKQKQQPDFWAKIFLRIARDAKEINTVLDDWSKTGDDRENARQGLSKAPQHLAIALEHYCEKASKRVFINQAREQGFSINEDSPVTFSIIYFINVLDITRQNYQIPSSENFLFSNINEIHRFFNSFDLNLPDAKVENWAFSRLHKRTFDKINRQLNPERNENQWCVLYHFCEKFDKATPDNKQRTINRLRIPGNEIINFTTLISVFINKNNYEPDKEVRYGKEQNRYRDPTQEELEGMANQFNQSLLLNKDPQEMKDELINLYKIIKTKLTEREIIFLDDDSKITEHLEKQETKELYCLEINDLIEQIPDFLRKLSNDCQHPYQVLLLLDYGFEDDIFLTEEDIFLTGDQQHNVKLNQTKIGKILGGIKQPRVNQHKRVALQILIKFIGEWSQIDLNLEKIASVKNVLNKKLLPDYYFKLICSWFVNDLARITREQRNIPEIQLEIKELLKAKIKLKFIIEINKAQIVATSDTLKLLEPPIDRLLEKYVENYNIFT